VTRALSSLLPLRVSGVYSPEDPNMELVRVLNVLEPMFLSLDNNHKAKTAKMYGRYAAPGSVMFVHDWEQRDLSRPHWDVARADIMGTLLALGYTPQYFDFAEHINSATRVFVRG
jgi:hypothetical protein